MATKKTTNNATLPDPNQVTFNPAALPPAKPPTLSQLAANQAGILASAQKGATQANSDLATAKANQASTIAGNTTLGNTFGGTTNPTTGNITLPVGGPVIPGSTSASNAATTVDSGTQQVLTWLNSIGLGSLTPLVMGWAGKSYSYDVMLSMIRTQPAYAAAFPAIAQLRQGDPTIDETSYLAKVQADRDLLYRYLGDSAKAYDNPQSLGSLMINNVSTATLQTRLQSIHDIVNASPDTKAWLQSNYGLSAQDLAAAWLDPNTTADMVAKRDVMAQIGGAGITSGFGNITQAQAEALANQGLTQSQAQSGFTNLAQEKQFGIQLPGESGKALNQDQLINSQFGTNGNDVTALKNIQQSRINEFNAGGAVAATTGGLTGVGSSNLTS